MNAQNEAIPESKKNNSRKEKNQSRLAKLEKVKEGAEDDIQKDRKERYCRSIGNNRVCKGKNEKYGVGSVAERLSK